MFTVDGITWPYPCDIERVAEMTPSEISGMLLDNTYFNDVLGTFMRYTVKIAVPINAMDAYAQIYEALTEPVDGHAFVLPYNSSTISVTGRVGNVSDVYVRMANGGIYWRGIQFEVTSNAPSKELSLSEVITRGRAPLPDVSGVQVGDTYTYTASGWVKVLDADDTGY